MPASACGVFLGQAPEDRNRCCLNKHNETQKAAATPATSARAPVLGPFLSSFRSLRLSLSASPRLRVNLFSFQWATCAQSRPRRMESHASRGERGDAEVGTDDVEAFFAAWRLGGFSCPCSFTNQGSGSKAAKPQSRQGGTAARRTTRRVGRACDDAGAMPASACEVFLGQAPEDRNGYCLKKHKETQKAAATSAGSLPLF
jgi:hypothetical protein